jgi:hypothetical protein
MAALDDRARLELGSRSAGYLAPFRFEWGHYDGRFHRYFQFLITECTLDSPLVARRSRDLPAPVVRVANTLANARRILHHVRL